MAVFTYGTTTIFYEEMGQGVPFLLIHGWAIDHRLLMNGLEPIFTEVEDDLGSRNFRRIYVDLPGMGQSQPGDVKNGDDVIEVLMHMMDELAPGEQFYIGGNSFGGFTCRAIMAKYPNRIKGALLIVPGSRLGVAIPAEKSLYRQDEAFLMTLTEEQQKFFTVLNSNRTADVWSRYEKEALPSVLDNKDNEFLKKRFKGSFSFDVDAAQRKKPFAGPVLIVTGRYDTAVGFETQFEWFKMFPKASYIAMDGAGHIAQIDQPELFRGVVSGWLKGIAGGNLV